ncbi:hypothetical protein [Sphingobium boeckii]|uniref:EthD domain-containing protein n=1 Tax=Sphingobium boeckii TaxID=1082345 RepID=A0A7W9AKT5_9SPHN|nr:hypothetical protein [Sphingobium boeckii]MBB5687520.1 hypothetical protein [Sphingobium boeckii]
MKKSVRLTAALLMGAFLTPIAATSASAQALSGRSLPDRPRLGVSYYKTPPGKQDEWLALYLKWHRPIMEYQIKQGVTTSSTVYANSGHSIEPSWDFMIVSVSPPPSTVKPLTKTRGEIIQELYPDIDAYVAGEKKRWEFTISHWDLDVTEVDLTAEHPGVYYPILPKKK